MNTALKGNATEAALRNAFVARGFGVLMPFGEGQPFDLVVHVGGHDFLRVQCKTARLVDGCVGFNSRSTDHGRGPRLYTGLADIFGVYFPPSRSIYLVPVAEISGFSVQLRLEAARNNQRRRIRLTADYLIEHWTDDAIKSLCRTARADDRGRALQVA